MTTGFLASELTPRQIVAELDKFIIGQARAKRVVAIALRNRARRRQLAAGLREEVSPKNILMIGPTGVGKTEIARRLAKLARAPFLKVEATKFTEVGYVGRDVESMVRDLVEMGVKLVKDEKTEALRDPVEEVVWNRLLDMIEPPPSSVKTRRRTVDGRPEVDYELPSAPAGQEATHPAHLWWKRREAMKPALAAGRFDDREVEVKVVQKPALPFPMGGMPMGGPPGMGGGMDLGNELSSMFESLMPKKEKQVRVRLAEAKRILFEEEVEGLLDMDKIKIEALERTEQDGIIFIDEFDKIAGRGGADGVRGPDVSREGVQRDILPIVEGSTVSTKHGMVSTDHILFIAAGAFHVSKPSDLIPELQGRFPLRVELADLTRDDLRRVLTEPENALTRQYQELLATEGVELAWEEDGIDEIARIAVDVNSSQENIGARRLHTILENLLEDISYEAPDMGVGRIAINRGFVQAALKDILADQDLARYIL